MKYNDFKKIITKPYFTQQDLRLQRIAIYNYQLSLWQDKGYISHIKRGIYYFCDQKEQITPEEVSFLLYEPSYMSLESALSHYGIIPEIIHAITAVSTKTTRQFENDFGSFIYKHIQPSLFFGYTSTVLPHGKYLLATPEKALLDFLYLHLGDINNKQDIKELRLNDKELKQVISPKTLLSYLAEFQIKKLQKITHLILQ